MLFNQNSIEIEKVSAEIKRGEHFYSCNAADCLESAARIDVIWLPTAKVLHWQRTIIFYCQNCETSITGYNRQEKGIVIINF